MRRGAGRPMAPAPRAVRKPVASGPAPERQEKWLTLTYFIGAKARVSAPSKW